MTLTGIIAVGAMAVVAVLSAVLGRLSARNRSTSDFLVASRTVRPAANAAAVSGEYLSAASFLGVAGLILRDGVDALWYPIGFATGYLSLVLFVAAPLRRSGAYTVPDFAEGRLHSTALRRVCVCIVVLIGWLYLLPQLQGAGLTLTIVTGLPAWYGEAAAAVVVVGTVLFGGMRSITFVQALQYWLKFTALAVPVLIALVLVFPGADALGRPAPPTFPRDTVVHIDTDVTLQVAAPVTITASGRVDGTRASRAVLNWAPGPHTAGAGSDLSFPAGASVPIVAGAPLHNDDWLTPFQSGRPDALLATYSLLLATFLGTMGLPHVLGRFYTSADGRAARRTAVGVLALIGAFYAMVTVLGLLARLYTPQLLVTGATDAAVLVLPAAVLGSSVLGVVVAAVVAAGAWTAFLSTSSGLVVSISGVIATDVLGSGRTRDFRLATVIAGVVPLLLALGVNRLDFGEAVALVFAVAASTFCPLLVLGIWWRGLTAPGAVAGILVGGVLSTGPVCATVVGVSMPGLAGVLLHRPAIVSVPAAFLVMIVISLFTAGSRPDDAEQVVLRLHAPERLGLTKDRLADRLRGPAG